MQLTGTINPPGGAVALFYTTVSIHFHFIIIHINNYVLGYCPNSRQLLFVRGASVGVYFVFDSRSRRIRQSAAISKIPEELVVNFALIML